MRSLLAEYLGGEEKAAEYRRSEDARQRWSALCERASSLNSARSATRPAEYDDTYLRQKLEQLEIDNLHLRRDVAKSFEALREDIARTITDIAGS